MRMMLMGAPGAGKGTQAHRLGQRFGIAQVSTGDILRQRIASGSVLGQRVKTLMDAGELVSDDIILELVKERLDDDDCRDGYLFDGFPRTLAQARALDAAGIDLEAVVALQVDDDLIVGRMSGRRVHLGSGRTYHVEFNPPRVEDVDDVTGEPLVLRADDAPHTVRDRLAIYHQQTRPLIEYYREIALAPGGARLLEVDGVGSVDEVEQRIVDALHRADANNSDGGVT